MIGQAAEGRCRSSRRPISTAGPTRTTAAPTIRAVTAAPGDHPASINALAKAPEIANDRADSSANAVPRAVPPRHCPGAIPRTMNHLNSNRQPVVNQELVMSHMIDDS